MIQKLKEWSGVIALIAIIVLVTLGDIEGGVKFGTAAPSGSISYYTALSSQYGYYVGVYNTATQIIDDSGNFVANLFAKGGITFSYTNSTSTVATTQTLNAADLEVAGAAYSTVVFTPNTASVTLTFPASSTLSVFLPNAGDRTEQCWLNATGTAATKITFAAGTGWDFEVASTTLAAAATVAQSPLLPGNSTCFRFVRKAATASTFDIIAQLVTYVDGD